MAAQRSMHPLISVITPSYNHADYIRQTIESVLAQDYPAIEHIVVDGGSTDGTVEILREYGERYPDRFRWVSERDRGQADALNKGLAMARGEFIGWQNSDDYYLPHTFAEPIHYLIDHPEVTAVYSGCQWVDEAGRIIGHFPAGPFDYARLLEFCTVPNQAAFIRRDALRACGGVSIELHYVMDYDLWLRLSLQHRIVFIPGIRAAWRLLETAKTHASLLTARLETVELAERMLVHPLLPPELAPQARQALQRHVYNALLVALAYERQAEAKALLQKALDADPPLARWRYFCGEILARRVITSQSFGQPEPLLVQAVPGRALAQLAEVGFSRSVAARQIPPLIHVLRALYPDQQRTLRLMLPHLFRAAQTDPMLLCYPGPKVALLWLFYSNQVSFLMRAISMIWAARERLSAVLALLARGRNERRPDNL